MKAFELSDAYTHWGVAEETLEEALDAIKELVGNLSEGSFVDGVELDFSGEDGSWFGSVRVLGDVNDR